MYNHFAAASVAQSEVLQDLGAGLQSEWIPRTRDTKGFAPLGKEGRLESDYI